MLALIGAMDQEVSGLRRRMTAVNVDNRDRVVVYQGAYRGKKLLLARSGVGRQAAERACRCLLDHYPVTSIVSFGFCGALNPRLRVGDVVACLSVRGYETSGQVCQADASMLASAQACESPRASPGTGFTARGLVASRQDKRSLLDVSRADVVDMESYWIGAVAAESHIPFISVRVVSDSASDNLPELPSWKLRDVVPHFAVHPAQAFVLYRGLSRARKSMGAFLDRMIEVTG